MNTIKPAPVVRDDCGYWTHPDLPVWDEGTTREQIDAWAKENNGTIVVELMDGDAPEEVSDRYFECDVADCSYWYPHCSKAGNFLLSIHDTEDGPIAMFFVPTQSQAELDVIAERQRQVSAEGWIPEHDDNYRHGLLAMAASCYCLSSAFSESKERLCTPGSWPFDETWWKPTTARRDLVKAAALILAEIERLDRAAAKEAA